MEVVDLVRPPPAGAPPAQDLKTWLSDDLSGYTDEEREALTEWTSDRYVTIQSELRDAQPSAATAALVESIDTALARKPLPEEAVFHRGDGPELFGLATLKDLAAVQPGDVRQIPGYFATTTSQRVSKGFGTVQLEVKVPAGTPAAPLKRASNWSYEEEILLARDLIFIVDEIDASGSRPVVKITIVPLPQEEE